MSETTPQELYSLLIPLSTERLLVPRMCVAEVTAFAEPETPPDAGRPEWYLGTIAWNGRQIPVVSLDEPAGGEGRSARRRIVIFHALGDSLRVGHFGIVTQGFPQLVRVNRDVVAYDNETGVPADRPFVCRVRMIHEYPLVPDLDRIEEMLAEQLEPAA